MIEQQGKVVAVTKGKAGVRLGGVSGCSRCDAGRGCGAGIFGRLLKRRPVVLELENPVNAVPGQPVVVGIPEGLFLKYVFRLYLFPLLAAMTGAALGHFIAQTAGAGSLGSDMITLLSALAAGAAVLLWSRKNAREFPESFTVNLLRIIELDESIN